MVTQRNGRRAGHAGAPGRSAYGRGGYGNTSGRNGNGRPGNGQGGYVYDNLARQMEAVPERKRQPERRRRKRVQPQPKPVAMPGISSGAFLFLSLAIVVCLSFCFNYLRMQSGLTQMKSQAAVIQSEIAQMSADNAEKKQQIMDSVDLAEVYEIATGQLGMVQAVDNQVFQYRNKKSNMVRQYGDIPSSR